MTNKKRASRKSLAIALGIVGVAGLSMASAAQLTVASSNVSAGTQVVASCDTDGVTVGYTTSFSSATGKYIVTAVNVTGISASCNGRTLSVTLLDGTGSVALFDGSDTVLGSGTAAISTTSASITGLSISAVAVEGVAVAIA